MSWDVYVMAAPPHYTSADEMPEGFTAPPLGTAAEVLDRLRVRFPAMDLSDPTWGTLGTRAWSIEVNIGSDDPVDVIMLHVRGRGTAVIRTVIDIATAVGGRALDTTDSTFLAAPGNTWGWQRFRAFRDGLLSRKQ